MRSVMLPWPPHPKRVLEFTVPQPPSPTPIPLPVLGLPSFLSLDIPPAPLFQEKEKQIIPQVRASPASPPPSSSCLTCEPTWDVAQEVLGEGGKR